MALLVLALASAIAWFGSPATPLDGRVFVVDGDTLRVGQTRVRLTGLDAPELDQDCIRPSGEHWSCGSAAKDFLVGLVGGETAHCLRTGRDRYARALARCEVRGKDVGAEVVRAGWAVIDLAYFTEQSEAQAQKRGIWSGTFVFPTEWRRTKGEPEPALWEWIRAWFQ